MKNRAYLYILGASDNPDKIKCVVPFQINENLIFFGPCKKGLREMLKKDILKEKNSVNICDENIFFIGMNASNSQRIRKIVWVGRVTKLMTFEYAFNNLNSDEYRGMREHNASPLHVEPIYNDSKEFIGYRHISDEHKNNDEWIYDLVSSRKKVDIYFEKNEIHIKSGRTRKDTFDRDLCIILENIHFAKGKGIEINKEMIEILKDVQKNDCNDFAVFGKDKNGRVDGRRGKHLELEGEHCDKFIKIIGETNENHPKP